MKYGLPNRTISTLNRIFKRYDGIKKVILYGSRAKGNFKNGSDIDITLETDSEFSHAQLLKIMNDFDDSDIPYTVDVSLYKYLEDANLKEHINRVGKIFYKS